MERRPFLQDLRSLLGPSQLVWFGTRGDDVEGIADLPQLEAAFSLISAYTARSTVSSVALEDITGRRLDLDVFDIDEVRSDPHLLEFRRQLLRTLSRESTVVAYRPSSFLSAAHFARLDRCRYLGLFSDHQSAFEHKPWVETSIAALGIPHVRWQYIADEEQVNAQRLFSSGPIMLRRSRTNGGVGLTLAHDPSELATLWPAEDEAFVSVASYLEGATPVNVGGVVWHDGVTVHPASVQLIGVAALTSRQFGYCGNDFGLVDDVFDREQLNAIEDSTVLVGEWLRSHGYRGAFGVDYLVMRGVPLFIEVNPRFQGSTRASCQISAESDESCIMSEHLAANLGMDAPQRRSLRWLASLEPLSHAVVHWTGVAPARLDPTGLVRDLAECSPGVQGDVLTRPDLWTDPGATVGRFTARTRITETGFELRTAWEEAIRTNLGTGTGERRATLGEVGG